MEVVLPPSTGSGASITRKLKWDCRKQDGGVTEIVSRTIDLDHVHKISVTYLVMDNVVEAKLEVKLRLKGGREESAEYSLNQHGRGKEEPEGMEGSKDGGKKYTASGKIVARINGFERHPIVLFTTEGDEKFPLDLETPILMRSSVSVPFGKGLDIDMEHLHIKEAPGGRLVKKPSKLSYNFRGWTPTPPIAGDQVVDGNIEVEVNVAWPAQEETVEIVPDVVFIIGDKEKFSSFIDDLRDVLVDHADPEDVLDGYTGEEHLDTRKHPVLARQRPFKQPPRWIHVELQVGHGEEKSSMTLALRNDECYGVGFMNQNGVWYDLGQLVPWYTRGGDKQLPPEYYSVLLDWGYHLCSNVAYYEVITEKLGSIRLGKDSAMAAVRTLSRYPDVEEDEKPMLALTVLFIMICESARFNPIFKSIEDGWDTGTELTEKQYAYTRSWRQISVDLLSWKDDGHKGNQTWPQYEKMEINGPLDALRVVRLVFNSVDERTKQEFKCLVCSPTL